MKKFRRRPREFSWPALPVLDTFVLFDLIETYNGKGAATQIPPCTEEAEARGYADACVRNAEREVLHRLTAFAQDFGHNVSLWHPSFLTRIAKRCPRESFPAGLECLQNLHTIATRVGVPGVRTGAHMLALERLG